MKTERIMRELARINVEDNCHYCQKNGCRNADGKQVPCDHTGNCPCDDECMCECHYWARIITLAHNRLNMCISDQTKEAA